MAIDYGQPADNQMQMDFGEKEAQLWKEAEQWTKDNPDAWAYFKSVAVDRSARGYASAKLCAELTRDKFHVSIKNDYTSSFARMAMEQDSRIKFKTKKSQVDGYAQVRL